MSKRNPIAMPATKRRVTVYVKAGLRERMNEHPEVKWSEIARLAFEAALRTAEHAAGAPSTPSAPSVPSAAAQPAATRRIRDAETA